jgi:hypothetical protein
MIMDSTGKREFIDINENSKVKDLKEALANKKGINTEVQIHLNGQFLEDNEKISDTDIEEDVPIIYVAQFRGGSN